MVNSHRFKIKHGNTDTPVAEHFCSNNHNIKDLLVTMLMSTFKRQECKEWEFKLMRNFNTLECGNRSFMFRCGFN
ncbi:hypothetical protein XELAEV_18032070mg [Xenopus laevis]|uniref:Uncharacterized protein n=1 Tax=Xenopus laevis TaxID=8355 RepID=A0A974CQF1_XENLA|nr:hypothetical protein XELAEV_18032070mg [Xenopus laevis]